LNFILKTLDIGNYQTEEDVQSYPVTNPLEYTRIQDGKIEEINEKGLCQLFWTTFGRGY
jgi:hypothetical protein